MEIIHKCEVCNNTLIEIDEMFPPESKTWQRVKHDKEGITQWYCSEECLNKALSEMGAVKLNRETRRKLQKTLGEGKPK